MHVKLIDANALSWVQFHAADEMVVRQGEPSHATKGVVGWVRHSLRREPDALHVLVWDGHAKWRYDILPGYKSSRSNNELKRRQRIDFNRQLPWTRQLLNHFPVIQVRHPGAEADDTGWGLCHALTSQGHFVELCTEDSDWQQMLNARCEWRNLKKLRKLVRHTDFPGHAAHEWCTQTKAITGDSADDIPGIENIAVKRATQLLARYGNLRGVLAASTDPFAFAGEHKWAHGLALPESHAVIERNLQLVDLARGPELAGWDVDVVVGDRDDIELMMNFEDMEFIDWHESYGGFMRGIPQTPDASGVQVVRRALRDWSSAWSPRIELNMR